MPNLTNEMLRQAGELPQVTIDGPGPEISFDYVVQSHNLLVLKTDFQENSGDTKYTSGFTSTRHNPYESLLIDTGDSESPTNLEDQVEVWFECKANYMRFINHSCKPNCQISYIYSGSMQTDIPEIAVFTSDIVTANTELTIHYLPNSLKKPPPGFKSPRRRGRTIKEAGRVLDEVIGAARRRRNAAIAGRSPLVRVRRERHSNIPELVPVTRSDPSSGFETMLYDIGRNRCSTATYRALGACRLYYTTPSKLLSTRSKDDIDVKEYEGLQLYLIETLSTNASLLLCALLECDSRHTMFSANCQKMVSMRPVVSDLLSATVAQTTQFHIGQPEDATRLRIDFETVQVVILLTHVEFRRELTDLIQDWLSDKTSTSQPQVPTELEVHNLRVITADGPHDSNREDFRMFEYLLWCARAVDTTKKVEEADFVFGALEDLYFEEDEQATGGSPRNDQLITTGTSGLGHQALPSASLVGALQFIFMGPWRTVLPGKALDLFRKATAEFRRDHCQPQREWTRLSQLV
ncbi:hypothetical protein C8Q80DRAFT_1124713 [Daedaleopsis nitida]|nr:hypothetical protein C8Q80DRAFT_1124713 [Daedaleopsis nitida]